MQDLLVPAIVFMFFIFSSALFLLPSPPTQLLQVGETDHLLRALDILPEDRGSIPGIQVAAHEPSVPPISRDPMSPSGLCVGL